MLNLTGVQLLKGFQVREPVREKSDKAMLITAVARNDAHCFWSNGRPIPNPYRHDDPATALLWRTEFQAELGALQCPYQRTDSFMRSQFG